MSLQENICQSLTHVAAERNTSVFFKFPHIHLSGCCELITNKNNNNKHIIQMRDCLPQHSALPFIILKAHSSQAEADPTEQ